MNRLATALAPLILVASAVGAQAQDPHAGHVLPSAPATPPAAAQAAPDPHAGHRAPRAQTPPAADPHAGHRTPPEPKPADPHAGHDMSTTAPTTGVDPHARHPAPQEPQAADPHAGHDVSAPVSAQDPRPSHEVAMAGMGPPDAPTSADDPGRPPEDPVPAAAIGGPIHAADLIFGAEAMNRAREILIAENGDIRTTGTLVDRLEAGFGDGAETWLWDVQGWSGGDFNRFWWKSEGKGEIGGKLEEAEVQALYSRAFTPFWNFQAGVRQDLRPEGEDTTHLVFGVQGLAPHWWEMDAAAFLSSEGDLTARVQAEYDQRITQRLILQPRAEVGLSAEDIPDLSIGSGVTSVQLGARLRYEIRKEFAPYVGVEWTKRLGRTADYLDAAGQDTEEARIVLGLRAWF